MRWREVRKRSAYQVNYISSNNWLACGPEKNKDYGAQWWSWNQTDVLAFRVSFPLRSKTLVYAVWQIIRWEWLLQKTMDSAHITSVRQCFPHEYYFQARVYQWQCCWRSKSADCNEFEIFTLEFWGELCGMRFFNFPLAPFGVFRLGTSRGETFIIGARDIVFLLFQAMRCWFNQRIHFQIHIRTSLDKRTLDFPPSRSQEMDKESENLTQRKERPGPYNIIGLNRNHGRGREGWTPTIWSSPTYSGSHVSTQWFSLFPFFLTSFTIY